VGNKKGAAHLIPIVIIFAVTLLLIGALFYTKVLNKKIPSITNKSNNQEASVQIKKDYQNPFDKNTQYVNPFDQTKNPFDNLK